MSDIFRKLTSRKLWLAITGVATGIATVLGADSSDISIVAGAIVSIFSVATYIITEGKIDAERVKNAVENTQDAITVIEGTEDND